ncbi:unnamed protein product [Angiostrongylus costaricensis]|uniref:Serine-type D-Ala-D-Ala carboxypeptidase n=1 Tax=Angiostrongylus costaricensis TaxID=334426 RepID=A0A0R3PBF7_ANGCS|nr:unnamed protein product [Angiostrongylus costaricensis]
MVRARGTTVERARNMIQMLGYSGKAYAIHLMPVRHKESKVQCAQKRNDAIMSSMGFAMRINGRDADGTVAVVADSRPATTDIATCRRSVIGSVLS